MGDRGAGAEYGARIFVSDSWDAVRREGRRGGAVHVYCELWRHVVAVAVGESF